MVKRVIDDYKDAYPEIWTHEASKSTKQRRKKEGVCKSSTMNRRQSGRSSSFTLPYD